jgi:hypothetical protein
VLPVFQATKYLASWRGALSGVEYVKKEEGLDDIRKYSGPSAPSAKHSSKLPNSRDLEKYELASSEISAAPGKTKK